MTDVGFQVKAIKLDVNEVIAGTIEATLLKYVHEVTMGLELGNFVFEDRRHQGAEVFACETLKN
jgi:hypothetical protein